MTVPAVVLTITPPVDVVAIPVPQPSVTPITGIPGPQGPPGSAGAAQTHVQSAPAAQWSIQWTARPTVPAVAVYVAGRLVVADVDATALPTVLLTFATPVSGVAVLT